MPSLSAVRHPRFASLALSLILAAAGCHLDFTPNVEA